MKKNIEEFPGYRVTRDGRVWSDSYGDFIKGQVDSGGRIRVSLSKDGKKYKRPVSRLVAETYVEKEQGKTLVDHIDGNRNNNNASNLRWVTDEENQQHRDSQGISGKEGLAKKILYDGVKYDGIRQLARIISRNRGCLPDTARKAIQGARYGEITLYGKKLKFL